MIQQKEIRRRFYRALLVGMGVIWPISSALLGGIFCLGLLVGYLEGWYGLEGVYFAFVTGLTVGYGDFVPKHLASRIIAISIGFGGVLLTALFAAISVRALETALRETPDQSPAAENVTDV